MTQPIEWLDAYLQSEKLNNNNNEVEPKSNKKTTTQKTYELPLGQIRVLKITSIPSSSDTKTAIEATRLAAIKFALRWKKHLLKQNKSEQRDSAYLLILEIKSSGNSEDSVSETDSNPDLSAMMTGFGAQYAIEHLAADAKESGSVLQVFSRRDWQTLLATLPTPNELWRLLQYHKAALQQSFASAQPSFDSEQALISQFMNSPAIYAQAIGIDNALIKYGIQDEPNNALVAMSLAQKNSEVNSELFYEQMRQAAILWAQLSAQMLSESQSGTPLKLWQRQLLEESLFSRHELIRTLYQHPSRPIDRQKNGYVVHQHSYENLGRHYVMIFYGQKPEGKQSRRSIAPNLATIAKDVALRLPIAELHHIIVLGIEFIVDEEDTFIDIDLFIQPVTAMSQKERQLTKQLQRLTNQQRDPKRDHKVADSSDASQKARELPRVQLSFNIPANKNKG